MEDIHTGHMVCSAIASSRKEMNFVVLETNLRYDEGMSKTATNNQILREAMHLQAMEGNALDAEDKTMFDMFERKGWSDKQRREYILEQAQSESLAPPAERAIPDIVIRQIIQLSSTNFI
jgi:hypothetical protein